jgi:hypothetical protein
MEARHRESAGEKEPD